MSLKGKAKFTENVKINLSRRFFQGFLWAQSETKNTYLTGSCRHVSCIWREISVVYSQRKCVALQHTQFVALVRARARISVDLRATCAA